LQSLAATNLSVVNKSRRGAARALLGGVFMAEDTEKKGQQSGQSGQGQQSGQSGQQEQGQHGGQPGQQSGQPGQHSQQQPAQQPAKKGGQGQVDEEDENRDNKRRAS